ncbi:ribonuclease HIII [Metamycoplasma phocicerebrale]|uniref:Ribonuclease n=1 Tax=Metamycoplasma phocicerebrale TaxID=142649 RepID=A0A3T0TT69_9BACT|nr:ribonuclease HIII [Metamycoplasma phocicerebrale]AZZ65277.1 ribonuclease HIII [Metamycoplasma phocicerebrale]
MAKINTEYIGVDETGVGDYFTPVVSVACYIPNYNIEKIKALGIKDSKKLTDKKIIEIAKEIENKKLVYYRKTILSQKGYNNLTKMNINNNAVKTLIHFNSISRLVNSLKKNLPIVIDQYSSLDKIKEHNLKLKEKNFFLDVNINDYQLILETKAEDEYLSVACASILARYILLNIMEEQKKKYNGFNFKLGASNQIIDIAAEFIKKYGEKELYNVAKVSFKTTEKAKNKIN